MQKHAWEMCESFGWWLEISVAAPTVWITKCNVWTHGQETDPHGFVMFCHVVWSPWNRWPWKIHENAAVPSRGRWILLTSPRKKTRSFPRVPWVPMGRWCDPSRSERPLRWQHTVAEETPGSSRGDSGIRHLQQFRYPLVMTNVAIENGHRNSGFSH